MKRDILFISLAKITKRTERAPVSGYLSYNTRLAYARIWDPVWQAQTEDMKLMLRICQ
jgi:hypothetical protein